jgi:two-component system, NarL family, nitrate/nitrite sensor histidine kinase NarX
MERAVSMPLRVDPSDDDRLDEEQALSAALEAFLATVVKLARARAGAVRALTPDAATLRLVAAVGLPDDVVRTESIVGACGVCGEAAGGCGVRIADDPTGCGRLAAREFIGGVCMGTIAVPLEYKGRTVGVFTLFFESVDDMRAEVINLLRPIGQLLGLALENAKLQGDQMRSSLAQERRVMASEIHDSLAQSITFVRMRMPLLTDAIAQGDQTRALKYCADVTDELGDANRRLRELITQFRTSMDAPGLHRALADIAGSFHARTGIVLEFQSRVPELDLPVAKEMQVYHIVTEALANVSRHSGAQHVRVALDRDGDRAVLVVEDDGRGLAPKAPRQRDLHFGLDIMRQRAKMIGGRVDVEAAAGGGTRVRLSFPAPMRHEEADA